MTHVSHGCEYDYSFHAVQPHPFVDSYLPTSEDAFVTSSRSRVVSIGADSGDTLSMDCISSAEELRLMEEDEMEPIPRRGVSSDRNESAIQSFRFSLGTNTRHFGSNNDGIQERLPFPLKSDCSLDDMAMVVFDADGSMMIPADEEDPLELFKSTLNRDWGHGHVCAPVKSASQMRDCSIDDMLKFLLNSKCSVEIPTEGEEACALDQFDFGKRMEGEAHTCRIDHFNNGSTRPGHDCSDPPRIIVPNANDVLCGKGGKTVDHNLHYTRLCVQVANDYATTKKRGWSGKKGVALSVVQAIQLSGGRFLKPSAGGKGWDVLSEEKCIDKAAHCIRDVIRRHRRPMHRRMGD
jgi:hypothetical protein